MNNFAQFGAIAALNGGFEYFENLKNSFKSRVKLMVDGINEIKGFSCNYPNGTFYCFVNIKKTNFTSTDLETLVYEKKVNERLFANTHGSEYLTSILVVVNKKN